MTIGTRLYTLFKGRQVGQDEFGNRYFEEKHIPKHRRRKRWVMFRGLAEPSKVPPAWHGWLHYTHNELPEGKKSHAHAWQKEPLPNLTGTVNAYLPQGHLLKGGHHAPTTSDYRAWKP